MKYSELTAKNREELQKELKEKKQQLFSLRMKLKTMQLSNTGEIKLKRREIAQTQTAIRQAEITAAIKAIEADIKAEIKGESK